MSLSDCITPTVAVPPPSLKGFLLFLCGQRLTVDLASLRSHPHPVCPRVVHGLGRPMGWVGSGCVDIFSFLVGWVALGCGSKISTNSYPRYISNMFVICIKL